MDIFLLAISNKVTEADYDTNGYKLKVYSYDCDWCGGKVIIVVKKLGSEVVERRLITVCDCSIGDV